MKTKTKLLLGLLASIGLSIWVFTTPVDQPILAFIGGFGTVFFGIGYFYED